MHALLFNICCLSVLQDGILESTAPTTIENHDEMQDNSPQETGSPSPTDTSHSSLASTTHNPSNMQLPLCVPAPSSGNGICSDNGNKPGQNLDIPGTVASGVSQQRATESLSPDSLTMTQHHSGQNFEHIPASKTHNEFLHEQIKLFKEKQIQLAKLQSQIESLVRVQATTKLPVSVDNVNNVNVDAVFQATDNAVVTNTEYMKQTVTRDITEATQGATIFTNVDLDLNSNMTVKSTNADKRRDHAHSPGGMDNSPVVYGGHTSDFTTPVKQTPLEDALTPFILRNPSISSQGQDVEFKVHSDGSSVCHTPVNTVKLGSYNSVKGPELDSNIDIDTKPDITVPPLMTPMAMKFLARQQKGEVLKPADVVTNLNENVTNTTTIENEDISDGQALSWDNSESVLESRGLKTPPSVKRTSAFRKLGQSGLTPVVGSMSLRANSTKKSSSGEKGTKRKNGGVIKGHMLQLANEHYLEALLDNEVELYTCRLVWEPAATIRCYDPVARTLLEGDDMVRIC